MDGRIIRDSSRCDIIFVGIKFQSLNIKFSLKNKTILKKWITTVLQKEKKTVGDINYIFCNDDYLHALNKKYLRHDTLTDILTFDLSGGLETAQPEFPGAQPITGDIFISIPRVMENAKKYSTPFDKELSRVMIHGILHLGGYLDKTKREKEKMRRKENEYLKLRN